MVSAMDDRVELEESELFDEAESSTTQPAPAMPIPARAHPPVRPRAALSDAGHSSDSDDDGILLDSDEELSERWTRNDTYSLQSSAGLGAGLSASGDSRGVEVLRSPPRQAQARPAMLASPFFAAGSLPARSGTAGDRGLARHLSNMEASMAAVPAAALGTSMPISIPMMPRPAGGSKGGKPGAPRFVPPHLLASAGEDAEEAGEVDLVELLSSSRLSPTTSFRRDKLTTRNAIMRATGFLEVPGAAVGAEPEHPPMLDTVLETEFQAEFLTQPGLAVAPLPGRPMARGGHRPTSSLTAMLGTPS